MPRPSTTATGFPASKLKKYTPEIPPTVTYVRTFSSGKADNQGTAGSCRGRTPLMRNGTIPTQPDPPNVSRLNCGGTWPRRSWTATGQCANRRSCQTWAMAHAPFGGGYGRCATLCKSAIATSLAQGSCQRGQQGAPKLGEAAATSASIAGSVLDGRP